MGRVAYVYVDGQDLPAQVEFAGGQGGVARLTRFEYDAQGRQVALEHQLATPGAGRQRYTFLYDGAHPDGSSSPGMQGFVTGISGPGFDKTLRYRSDGSPLSLRVRLHGWREIVQTYSYFADGTPRGTTSEVRGADGPSQQLQVEAALDDYGRIDHLRVAERQAIRLHYDPLGQPAGASLGDDATLAFARDPVTRRLNGVATTGPAWPDGASLAWERDADDHVQQETLELAGQSQTRAYSYNDRRFLSSWSEPAGAHAYGYSSPGVRETPAAGASYDAAGRLSALGGRAYSYGADGQLQSVVDAAGRRIDYTYDEAGQRLLKRVDGVPVRGYVGDDILTPSAHLRTVRVQGWRAGHWRNGEFVPGFADQRGSSLLDAQGQVAWAGPFGERPDPAADEAEALDYAGQGLDRDSGLVRMGNRDYAPALGRFISADPLYLLDPARCADDPVQCNLFAYALNNPLGQVDEDGLESEFADRWDLDAANAVRSLNRMVTAESPLPARAGAAWMRFSIGMTRETVDALRLGDGLRSGTWSGVGADGMRVVTAVGLVATPSLKALRAFKAVRPATVSAQRFGVLTKIGERTFQSPAGLRYGTYQTKMGEILDRTKHLLSHTKTLNDTSRIHTVFKADSKSVFRLVDEAWLRKGQPLKEGFRDIYFVNMARTIGTAGERVIKIVVEHGNHLVTAHPVK